MKIRNGFVSNSSSSCFICNCDGLKKNTNYSIEEVTIILKEIVAFYNIIFEKNRTFENMFEIPRIATENDIDMLVEFSSYSSYHNVKADEVKDEIIIFSKDDNSIPYELFEILSSKFHTNRIHLG